MEGVQLLVKALIRELYRGVIMKSISKEVCEHRMDVLSDMAADAISSGLKADLIVNSVRLLIGGVPDASRVLSLSIQKRGADPIFASAIAAHLADASSIHFTQLKKSS